MHTHAHTLYTRLCHLLLSPAAADHLAAARQLAIRRGGETKTLTKMTLQCDCLLVAIAFFNPLQHFRYEKRKKCASLRRSV